MQTWTHIPAWPLDQFIEFFFLYENAVFDHHWERFLPDGHIEMVIDLKDSVKHWSPTEQLQQPQEVYGGWISGVHRRFISIEAAAGASMLVIRFRPGRILPFISMPAQEIAGQVVVLDAIWGREFRELREQVLEAAGPAGKFAVLETFFTRKLSGPDALHPAMDYALARLAAFRHTGSIAAIAHKTGYSHKHLVSLFHRHVGVSPKQYSRILAFQEAVRLLEVHQKPDWPAVAYSCGYYDQAHFIHDFKAFSGYTPSFYLKKRGFYLNYLPLDR